MFKKLMATMAIMAALSPFAYALDTRGNEWAISDHIDGISAATFTWVLDRNGNMFPGVNKQFDIGSPTQAFRNVYFGGINVDSGIVSQVEVFLAPPSASTTAYINNTVSTTTLFTGGTTYGVVDLSLVQPPVPQNMVVVSSFTVGTATNSLTGQAVVFGTDSRGLATNETIAFSTNPGTGNVCWAFISSVTVTLSSVTSQSSPNVTVQIGRGVRLGLANTLILPTDVYMATEGTTAVSSGSVNSSFQSYEPQSKPNGTTNYRFAYKAKKSTP